MDLMNNENIQIMDYSCAKPDCYHCQMMAPVKEKEPVILKPVLAMDKYSKNKFWTYEENQLLLENINVSTLRLMPLLRRHSENAINNRKYVVRKLQGIKARGRWVSEININSKTWDKSGTQH